MKYLKITVEDSKVVDTNHNPFEEKQIKVEDVTLNDHVGEMIRVLLDDETAVLITGEFIKHFADRFQSDE